MTWRGCSHPLAVRMESSSFVSIAATRAPIGSRPVIPDFMSGSSKISASGVAMTWVGVGPRSEEHTSEIQSLMRISYAVFCLKKKTLKLPVTQQQHDSRRHLDS